MAHWVFGGGFLQEGGTLDFAGGVPVEMGSGFSALAAALVVGARKDYGRLALLPHNAIYVLLGAGLLWFGWFGFNGGSGVSTGDSSVLAFTNTLLTPACCLVTWFALDLVRGRQVTAIGAATAIIVGCVGITPAGGFVSPGWAMVLGVVAAIPSYAIIVWRPRTRVDETLDVLAAHGIAGLTGILFIGLVAQVDWNGISDGLFYGGGALLGDQALAVLVAPVYAFGATFVLLKAIGVLMPLRASERDEALGMDVVQHGEEAYATGEGAILVAPEPAQARSACRSPTRRSGYDRRGGYVVALSVRDELRIHEHGYGLLLAIILVSLSFQLAAPEGDLTHLVTVVLQGGTFLAALWTSQVRTRLLRIASILVIVATAGATAALALSGNVDGGAARILSFLLAIGAPLAIVHGVVRHFREEGQVTLQTMFGVLCIYLLLGSLFAFTYGVIDHVGAAPFFAQIAGEATSSDYLYFSFSTMTTTGYGDHPGSHRPRPLAGYQRAADRPGLPGDGRRGDRGQPGTPSSRAVSDESLRIRPADAGDAAAIARIHAQGIDERVATFETRHPTEASVAGLIASGAIVIVAERDAAVVGFAKLGSYSDPAPYYSGVGELTFYVDREARRAGIGTALVDGLEREADRRGYWKLVAKVFASNAASIELLVAAGWREVGLHRRHGTLDGEWRDVILLERLLAATSGD